MKMGEKLGLWFSGCAAGCGVGLYATGEILGAVIVSIIATIATSFSWRDTD